MKTISNKKQNQNQMLTAGKVLKARRLEVGKSIQQISLETKIQIKYIELIENDDYSEFNENVFVNGFIKIYAEHLSLDVEKVLAIYRRSAVEPAEVKKDRVTKESSKKEKISRHATPRNFVGSILLFVIIVILGYLSFQFYNFQKEPYLLVQSPENNTTVTEEKIPIIGETEEGTTIEINGQNVVLTDDYKFEEAMILNEGSNSITIRAFKDNNKSQETVTILNVRYEKGNTPEEEVIPTEPETPTTNTFKFSIINEPSWIQVYIDDSQEFAQVLNSGFTEEFEVTESVFLSTGKPASTIVFINGVETQLTVNPDLGTASISCEVVNNKLACE